MARCFCGCDRKVPISRRILNLRGRLVVERLGIVEQRFGRDIDDPTVQDWYATGDAFAAGLRRYVHMEPVYGSSIEAGDITAWQKFGQKLERQHRKAEAEAGLRAKRRMKELDMNTEEYLGAIGRGEIDP